MTPPENKMDKPQVPTPNLAPALWLEILKLPFVLILVAFVCLIVGNFFGALPTEFSGGGVSMKFEKRVKQADSNLNNKVQVLSIMLADMQAQQDSLTKVIRGLNGAGQGKAKMPSVATATSIDLPTPTDNLQAALVKVIADDNAHATSLKGKVGWIFIGDSVPGNPLRHGQVADANMQYIATPFRAIPARIDFRAKGNLSMRINLPPNNADYFGAVPRFGVVPRGTRIQLVQAPVGLNRSPFTKTPSVQYWAQVEVME